MILLRKSPNQPSPGQNPRKFSLNSSLFASNLHKFWSRSRFPSRRTPKSDRLLVAMKYATRKDRQAAVVELLIALLKDAPEDIKPIAYYLVRVYGYDEQTLRKIIREVRPREEEKMMSQFAREIQSKALQEGMQQGKQEKAVEMAGALLSKGMDISEVSEVSGLSEKEIRKLLIH
uniref:Transposase (putative) YhgA-like domain-containing protein n=1 Tax=Candidatus Kentrum sp. DK TaxID=2126562 RepID=A0A450TGN0_9GAMM|nr:MAG: conserved hypothetical protein (putative transposase or invertase) [Candidatus Kentron sp. DK]